MTYCLIQLAPGACDLLLNGEVIGSIIHTGERSKNTFWTAELLEDLLPNQRPAPFAEIEDTFLTLDALCEWLGNPKVTSTFGRTAVARSA
jgi:hypothetical protein